MYLSIDGVRWYARVASSPGGDSEKASLKIKNVIGSRAGQYQKLHIMIIMTVNILIINIIVIDQLS